MSPRSTAILSTVTLAALASVGCSDDDTDTGELGSYAGIVYAATNDATANAVVRYGRDADGRLARLDSTPTGGRGVGGRVVIPDAPAPMAVDPLFSNDSLVLSPDRDRLFVVNAGDSTISAFRVAGDGALTLAGTVPSGGMTPTGLALSDDLLYVAHAAPDDDGDQLTGFRVGSDGALAAIPGAAYAASGMTPLTHALFSPDGEKLVAVELLTGMLDVYPVNADGTLGTPVRNPSAAPGPFGGEFLDDDVLAMSEVHPGEMHAGSVSTYRVGADGTLTAISAAVSSGRDATCWLTKTPDGRWLFASNTTSGDVSVYRVADDGALTLAVASAAARAAQGATDFMGTPTSGPVDAAVSSDGKYFYQQYSGLGVVGTYRIGDDGNLTAVAGADGTGLPSLGS